MRNAQFGVKVSNCLLESVVQGLWFDAKGDSYTGRVLAPHVPGDATLYQHVEPKPNG